MKSIPLLLCALFVKAAFAQAPTIRPDYFDIRTAVNHPEIYDGLMIATVLGPAIGHPLGEHLCFAVQKVRIEDSRCFAPGTIVDVYFETTGGSGSDQPMMGVPLDQAGALPTGARAIIIARAVKDGRLRVPAFDGRGDQEGAALPIGSRSSPAALGLAFFLTARTRLAPSADPKWRLIESLAAAIPGAGDENARQITRMAADLPDPRKISNYGRADDRYSRTFVDAVAHDSAYHRALVDFALNQLRYWGYGDRFFHDLQEAAIDPNAFPTGIPVIQFEESPGTGNNPLLPKDFHHASPLTQAEILALVRRAKSPTLAAAYLSAVAAKPSNSDLRLMARFLDSPDPRLRAAFVERLAAWNGEPAPAEAKEVVGPDGTPRTEYPGLEAAVARWKAWFRVPKKA